VCRVFDIGETIVDGGQHFLSMEYIDGEDLASLLLRIGRLPADKALDIARQICAGLAAAHERGVLHRDLKPANVMLDGRGRVRITDFGLAVAADAAGLEADTSGTPAYMAPEQFAGKSASVGSDIYRSASCSTSCIRANALSQLLRSPSCARAKSRRCRPRPPN
jgi:serine/threonine protein kinase